MGFWPFKRKPPELLTPEQLRAALIDAAASGSPRKLRTLCEQYKGQVGENLDLMRKLPDGAPADPPSIERYMGCLIAVAQCLAEQCRAPELMNTLCGSPDDNPLLKWDRWYAELPERMKRLEYDALIAEARAFLSEISRWQSFAARQNEAFINGRLGELLFHSGRVREALEPFRTALQLCRDINDLQGQQAYLGNLLETHRYLDENPESIRAGEELIALRDTHRVDARVMRKMVERRRRREPLLRVVCVGGDNERELDELKGAAPGHYQFEFRRNRMQLAKCRVLTSQGNELASSGQLADALEKYQEAAEVDPHDPDPIHQSGVALLEMGAYAKAREAFEEVERLAPGWFRCRSDRWLAAGLEDGSVSFEEFQILRVLEDGRLPPAEALAGATKAVDKFPTFAPFYLALGDLHRDGNEAKAIACYRKGLELVAEPDLESRLLVALAGLLPKDSAERAELMRRALALKGSLVAHAAAALMNEMQAECRRSRRERISLRVAPKIMKFADWRRS